MCHLENIEKVVGREGRYVQGNFFLVHRLERKGGLLVEELEFTLSSQRVFWRARFQFL